MSPESSSSHSSGGRRSDLRCEKFEAVRISPKLRFRQTGANLTELGASPVVVVCCGSEQVKGLNRRIVKITRQTESWKLHFIVAVTSFFELC